MAVDYPSLREIALSLPEVEEGTWYGTPGFRVGKTYFTRLRDEGETLVVKCGDAERDFRMQQDPHVFFITYHYRGYPAVLVRLGEVNPEDLREVLEEAWLFNAPQRLVAKHFPQA